MRGYFKPELVERSSLMQSPDVLRHRVLDRSALNHEGAEAVHIEKLLTPVLFA